MPEFNNRTDTRPWESFLWHWAHIRPKSSYKRSQANKSKQEVQKT